MKSKMKWFLSIAIVIALCAFSASIFIQPKAQAQDERGQYRQQSPSLLHANAPRILRSSRGQTPGHIVSAPAHRQRPGV